MSSVNVVILLGRLTRDPDVTVFSTGLKVARLGLAVNDRKQVDGEWTDVPTFVDIDVFDHKEGSGPATTSEKYLKKGQRVHVEGRLKLETWNDKTTGEKKSKLKVIGHRVTLIEPAPQRDDDRGDSRGDRRDEGRRDSRDSRDTRGTRTTRDSRDSRDSEARREEEPRGRQGYQQRSETRGEARNGAPAQRRQPPVSRTPPPGYEDDAVMDEEDIPF
jgi:single-strand DNA-binding protein